MDGDTTDKIIEQVRKCPSGAMSYFLNAESPAEPGKGIAESATIMKVEVTANGPYLMRSECLIVLSNGKEETKTGTIALCRCGGSQNKPCRDGGHKKIELRLIF